MTRDRHNHRPPIREVVSLSGDKENQHHHKERNDDLKVSLESEPVFQPVDGMSTLIADHPHSKVSLNRVHPATQVATALIAAGPDPTPEVILGVQDRTPAAVAVSHMAEPARSSSPVKIWRRPRKGPLHCRANSVTSKAISERSDLTAVLCDKHVYRGSRDIHASVLSAN